MKINLQIFEINHEQKLFRELVFYFKAIVDKKITIKKLNF